MDEDRPRRRERAKPNYETLTVEEYKYGNNFIEVARKKVDDREFISLSKGRYMPDGSKRYKGGIGFPDDAELKAFIVQTLQQL